MKSIIKQFRPEFDKKVEINSNKKNKQDLNGGVYPERSRGEDPKLSRRVHPELSRRETQILKLLLAEYKQSEICKVLNIHANTVSSIKRNIMNKWRVTSIISLVKEAIKRGYLELDDDPIIEHV